MYRHFKSSMKFLGDLELDERDVMPLFLERSITPKELFITLMETYAKRAGKPRWGEKSPPHFFHLDELLSWFPKAKVIYLSRDGRDVIPSIQKTPWGSDKSFWYLARMWKLSIRTLRKALERWPDQILLVRFEDLVSAPESECRRMMDFLGEKFEGSQLDPSIGSDAIRPYEESWKKKATVAPDRSRAMAWKTTMDKETLDRMNFALNPELAEQGYPDARVGVGRLRILGFRSSRFTDAVLRKFRKWVRDLRGLVTRTRH